MLAHLYDINVVGDRLPGSPQPRLQEIKVSD